MGAGATCLFACFNFESALVEKVLCIMLGHLREKNADMDETSPEIRTNRSGIQAFVAGDHHAEAGMEI